MPAELRRGTRGEAVRDLQQRLGALGRAVAPDDAGEFESGTETAVRTFQTERGLRADAIVGPDTWAALVEAGYGLGDRLLYHRRPMLRGDDVVELQRRLNSLGFDAGREDGIFGPDTQTAFTEFQRAPGLATDGICGSLAVATLRRVGTLAEGSVATVRERELLRAGPHRLAGRRIFVAATPGLAVLGEQLARRFAEAGVVVVTDTSGDQDSLLADAANRFGADLFLAVRSGTDPGWRCAHFATGRFRSEAGRVIAGAICDEVGRVLARPGEVAGRAYASLRETRMPAVVCELAQEGDVEAMRAVATAIGDVSQAMVRGVRAGVERPELDEA